MCTPALHWLPLFLYCNQSGDMSPNRCKGDEHEKHRRAEYEEVRRGAEGKHEGPGRAGENGAESAKRHGGSRSPGADRGRIYMGAHREHGGLNRVDEKALRCDSREQQEDVLILTKLTHE